MDCVGSGSAAAATMPAMLLTDCEFYTKEGESRERGRERARETAKKLIAIANIERLKINGQVAGSKGKQEGLQLSYEMKADYAILKERFPAEIVAQFIKQHQGYVEHGICMVYHIYQTYKDLKKININFNMKSLQVTRGKARQTKVSHHREAATLP